MNRLYIDGNYIIADDVSIPFIFNFRLIGSVYTKNSDPIGYTINAGQLVIATTDIGLWFDEAGVVAYTEATLVEFLRVNTGA